MWIKRLLMILVGRFCICFEGIWVNMSMDSQLRLWESVFGKVCSLIFSLLACRGLLILHLSFWAVWVFSFRSNMFTKCVKHTGVHWYKCVLTCWCDLGWQTRVKSQIIFAEMLAWLNYCLWQNIFLPFLEFIEYMDLRL